MISRVQSCMITILAAGAAIILLAVLAAWNLLFGLEDPDRTNLDRLERKEKK